MNVIVGCKVVAEEQDIKVLSDASLDLGGAVIKISPFDLNALQAAVDLKNLDQNINIKVLSIGDKNLENSKIQKDILSRGADELHIAVSDSFTNLLSHDTAEIFKNAAQSIGYDLIICGDGSADFFAGQVGVRAASKLNIPVVNGVKKIVSLNDKSIVVHCELEDEILELEVALPALICVSTDINTPAIPGMKAILVAAKKPVNKIEVNFTPSNLVELESIKAPKNKDRLGEIMQDDSDESVAKFIANIKSVLG
ncbi:Protein FixA [Campylobacter majalis]|uniref:Protein FixA n=1 Tax=Campylobacter majalis TaxID=2790656 RepID=A0ABN7KBV6_9BACT|nr:putative electron transfer flavoprotein FixA [Campylobacter majalis]CAD7289754.1 Protein FixA [Campylobacter majalis]